VVARTRPYTYVAEDQLAAMGRGLLVALDCIQDPRNLGAILRTAHGVGVTGVLLPRDRAVGVTPAVVHSAGGYAYRVPVARVTNLSRSLEHLRNLGWWAIGLDPGSDLPLWGATTGDRTLLVVGGEGRGLRPLVARSCDQLVGIPMLLGVESLNAAVAAGIALYEIGLRRRSPAVD
jgi:23S rRNA (guanosine2251-2'-O)-methyltransferase